MITSDLAAAANRRYDLVVIGGGIHGAQLALEATRCGLRTLLLEQHDFGGGASGNSLRILHGGLRYLQSADIRRCVNSVRERRWFARHFGHLVRPLPCLMPLYGRGTRSRSVMSAALAANDLLAWHRNRGVARASRLPASRTMNPAAACKLWPKLPQTARFEGGALWHDYCMISSERILMESLRHATAMGAWAVNHARVESLHVESGGVVGLRATSLLTGLGIDIEASMVANCGGSAARRFAAGVHTDLPQVFRPSLAFNVLLDRELGCECALAVSARPGEGDVHFLVPVGGRVLAGTAHVARPDGTQEARATAQEIEAFLASINAAVPGLDARPAQVLRVLQGLLPVERAGGIDLTSREVVLNHHRHGGPRGFFSVTGIKYTTSHAVAVAAVECISRAMSLQLPPRRSIAVPGEAAAGSRMLCDGRDFLASPDDAAGSLIRGLAAEEAAITAQDIILRRTNWWTTHDVDDELGMRVAALLATVNATSDRSRQSCV